MKKHGIHQQDQHWNSIIQGLTTFEPAERDFSDEVMRAIAGTRSTSRSAPNRLLVGNRQRRPILLAVIAAIAMLGGGVAYAAIDGWLSPPDRSIVIPVKPIEHRPLHLTVELTDRSNMKTMEVRSTGWAVNPVYEQIVERIRSGLSPGTRATIYFEPRITRDGSIKASHRNFTVDMTVPVTFTSLQDIVVRLDPLLASQVEPNVEGYEPTTHYVSPKNDGGDVAKSAPTFATDPQTDIRYAYVTQDVSGGMYDSIFWNFQKDGNPIQLNVYAAPEPEKFYDSNPSEDRLHTIHGMELYEYVSELEGTMMLIWAQKKPEGVVSFYLIADAGLRNDLFDFAEKLLAP